MCVLFQLDSHGTNLISASIFERKDPKILYFDLLESKKLTKSISKNDNDEYDPSFICSRTVTSEKIWFLL